MSEFISWSSELKTVENKKTKKTLYYLRICNEWRKISKICFETRCDDSNRADSFRTETKGDLIYQYKTVYGMLQKRGVT